MCHAEYAHSVKRGINTLDTWQVLKESISVLPKTDRKKVVFTFLLQIVLGLFDLLGVAIFGILGALAVNGVSSRTPGNRVSTVLDLLSLSQKTIQYQVTFLAIFATVLLVGKTMASVLFTRKVIFFLSRKGASISGELLSKLLNQSLVNVNSKSLQENLYAITSGVNLITVGVISNMVSLLADISLLSIMIFGLFVVDTLIALSTLLIFMAIGVTLHLLMVKRAQSIGSEQAILSIQSNQSILEILSGFREAFVRNRRFYYSRKISKERLKLADNAAEIAFMPNVSKYVLEITVVLGVLMISALQFSIHDAAHSVAVLSVFIAASTRISPAVLRVQQCLIMLRSNIASARPTLDLIKSLKHIETLRETSDALDFIHEGFNAEIKCERISCYYPEKKTPAIFDLSITINKGNSIAVVGPSGAGKTTLVDTIIGLIEPSQGTVTVSGLSPIDAIFNWPGAIAYVPQDTLVIKGSVADNVALGFPNTSYTENDIWEALKTAHLEEFVKLLPNGIHSEVGDRGTKLSGGQRQRLGIARAIFTKPKLLILDEATSSLDGKTEYDVSNSILEMQGKVTVITIAHRLSTVKNADQVIYLENGSLVAQGTFEEVRKSVPDFDEQAKLMGL